MRCWIVPITLLTLLAPQAGALTWRSVQPETYGGLDGLVRDSEGNVVGAASFLSYFDVYAWKKGDPMVMGPSLEWFGDYAAICPSRLCIGAEAYVAGPHVNSVDVAYQACGLGGCQHGFTAWRPAGAQVAVGDPLSDNELWLGTFTGQRHDDRAPDSGTVFACITVDGISKCKTLVYGHAPYSMIGTCGQHAGSCPPSKWYVDE